MHPVFLGSDGQVKTYAVSSVQPNAPIHRDLLLDLPGAHIYIMTSNTNSPDMQFVLIACGLGHFLKLRHRGASWPLGSEVTSPTVEKRPLAECGDHLDCSSCLAARDPYCGWCVLDGRWVWRDSEAPASLSAGGVTCSTPDADILPLIAPGDGQNNILHQLSHHPITTTDPPASHPHGRYTVNYVVNDNDNNNNNNNNDTTVPIHRTAEPDRSSHRSDHPSDRRIKHRSDHPSNRPNNRYRSYSRPSGLDWRWHGDSGEC
ncbi:hypothetical protein CRUP_025251 [Coryphaenoides rupestris]|nr:hypothetical protein CRUP_025251 [Coryphaenoides rupestris]